jgi:hypothetical protein
MRATTPVGDLPVNSPTPDPRDTVSRTSDGPVQGTAASLRVVGRTGSFYRPIRERGPA